MFREYDAELAQDELAADHKIAIAKHPMVNGRHTNEYTAECQILWLERACKLGLMNEYTRFSDCMADFYASLSWDPMTAKEQLRLIASDSRFDKIAATIKSEFNFDISADFWSVVSDKNFNIVDRIK